MSAICFIEARPRLIDSGAETTVRLAGGGTDTPYFHGGKHYRAGVVEQPRFRGSLGFDENGWTGATVPVSGGLNFSPGDPALVNELAALYWRDAAITVDAGEETEPLVRRLTGTVAEMAIGDGQIALTLVDPSKLVDKPLLGTGFAGTGGIEGPEEAAGRVKRRSWGRVANVEGRLLDKVNNIYEFGDPAHPLQAMTALRDKGRDGPVTLVAWQGSVQSTFDVLAAAVPQQGGGVVAPSIACAKWWTIPAGPLTADLQGETIGGYTHTPVGIAARLLAAIDGPEIADLAAADALRPVACGVHIASDADTVAKALDRLLLGVSLFWILQPDGTIRVGEWAWGAPVAALQGTFIGRERQLPPIKTRKIGYRRNHRQHDPSEISAAVLLAGDITYDDGTPLEDLKPAEGGATVGATAGENLTSSAGTVLDDADVITSQGTSADTSKVNGVLSTDVINAISTAQTDIDELFGTWSSGQAIVDAAQLAETNAQQAEDGAVVARTAAQTAQADAAANQTAAENAAADAGTFASSASSSAGTATTKAGEASTSAGQAATSATTAQGHAATASSQATLASDSRTDASRTAALLFPDNFGRDGEYWTQFTTGGQYPAALTAGTFLGVSGVGKVWQHQGFSNLLPRGYVKLIPGRRYRVEAKLRCLTNATNGGGTNCLIQWALGTMNADFAYESMQGTESSPGIASKSTLVEADGWVTLTRDFVPNATPNAWARPRVYFNWRGNGTTDGNSVVQVAYMKIIDVTEMVASEGSATAAADSASVATTKATEAGNFATSASSSANTATTKAGEAAGSATAASTSAGAAAASQTDAGNSASAAQGSAVSASAKAATKGVTANAGFDEGITGWTSAYQAAASSTTPTQMVATANWNGAANVALNSANARRDMRGPVSTIIPGRKYRIRYRYRVTAACSVLIGVTKFDAAGAYTNYNDLFTGFTNTVDTWIENSLLIDNAAVLDGHAQFAPFAKTNIGAVATTVAFDYLYIEDVTESESAAGSATAAATSSSSAAGSATTAGEQASAAQGHATTASTAAGTATTKASEASTSATTAQGHASTASAQATLASTSAGNANLTRAMLMPDRYDGAGQYFSASIDGDPATRTDLPSDATASGYGPVRTRNAVNATSADFATRGVVPAKPGRVYQVECEFQRTAQTGSGSPTVALWIRGQTDTYAATGVWGVSTTALTGDVQTLTFKISDVASSGVLAWGATAIWLRPMIRLTSVSGVDVTIQVRRLTVIDITESHAAAGSATAAAGSASVATTKASEAGSSATSATTAKNEAQAAQADAEAAASAASGSAASADADAATATSQANLASGYKSDAQAAATAASGSATGASGSASSASSSSTLAAGYATDAQTAARQTLPSTFESQATYFKGDATNTAPNNATYGTDGTYGPYVQTINPSGVGPYVATKGRLPTTNGKKWKVRALVAHVSGTEYQCTLRLEIWGAATGGTRTAVLSNGSTALPAGNPIWVEKIITATADGFVCPEILHNWSVAQAVQRCYALELIDVDALEAATAQASIATTQAAIATTQASAAQQSAILSASIGPGFLNRDPGFDDYPSATVGQLPAQWTYSPSSTGVAYRVSDAQGGYAIRLPSSAATNAWVAQNREADRLVKTDGYYVIEADIVLNSGALTGAGVLFRAKNAGLTASSDHPLTFSTAPDQTGTAPGAGVVGQSYQFRKLVKVTVADAKGFHLFAMSHWSSHGSIAAANDITWLKCAVRPAVPAEIRDQTVLGPMESTVSTHSSTLATHDTQLADLTTTVSTQGASITSQQTALNGLAVRYSVTLNVNGHVTGYQQNNNGTSGDFVVQADKFLVAMPGITPRVVFGVDATGVLVNGDLYVNNGKIVADTGTHMKVIGKGFGTAGQFVEWFGPKMAFNLCSEANAVTYIKTNGDAYFGGSLSAGVLTNAAQTSDLGSTALVEVGPFGTNGGSIVVTASWTYKQTLSKTYAANSTGASQFNADVATYEATDGGGGNYTGTVTQNAASSTLTLERAIGAGAYSSVATQSTTARTASFNGYPPDLAEGIEGYATIQISASVALTFTDTSSGTADKKFRGSISRGYTLSGGTVTQRISVATTEE